ncbi:hypothetical protein EFV37_24985 [Mesorhizobium loti]|uniref:Uncharacterized protein n=1 Tax=Mesorhizobium jarvisii TaxID=1777867 RepID=A0A6M7TLL5_9HYPH|nr:MULTISPECIES: hypothetical protein [Mesorhizobium]OBQ68422.1 hypothetical protein A9K72_09230 [Mesorhizobium loti]QKC65156.1 hypothetical protein EB229_24980 [Mesorhizobium jarvisii]QKD11071.1 hypothetical protein EFV37_24985 [Mesorhizobium loti]RJT31122.1 hypothetical protein D3242_22955 [Mesorhizobium jarvisii]
MKNDPEGRAALRLIRETVEEHCPPGVLPSEEAVNGIYGPGLIDEAEAIAAAIVATVERLQLRAATKPPAPNIAHK